MLYGPVRNGRVTWKEVPYLLRARPNIVQRMVVSGGGKVRNLALADKRLPLGATLDGGSGALGLPGFNLWSRVDRMYLYLQEE